MSNVLGRYHHEHTRDDGSVRWQCDVCPRECALAPGQRGFCYVREGSARGVELTTYGRSSGFCIDPIEKKPLAHFHPGTSVLSFGTAGCNLGCKFCQNWDISKSREDDTLQSAATPDVLAKAAADAGCASAAFTYNDPTIFLEYAVDCAKACRALGVHPVAVTNGYIHGGARVELYENMDAANIDLKAFTEKFYRDICAAHIEPVQETLVYVAKHTKCWLEITTLLIPGYNDSDDEVRALSEWVGAHVGDEVPLHFTAFHPDYKLVDAPPTPPSTLRRARTIAREVGLKHVYTGNIRDIDGQSTRCTSCGATVIGRDGYDILSWALDARGACSKCGTQLHARVDGPPGTWGSRRQRLHIL